MNAERVLYLDASAIVKLAVDEPESPALRAYLHPGQPLVSSAIARIEVLRALMGAGDDVRRRGTAALRRVELLRVNDKLLSRAGLLQPPQIRSLDAIHLATAQQLESELRAIITYDDRMADAARALGLRVVDPS